MMKPTEVEPAIKKVIAKHVDPKDSYVFLFGSRAAGGSRPASDYDIGIYRHEKIPLSVIARIKDELEDFPIPVDIEIVDFTTVTDEFKKLALRQIKIWNKPKTSLKLI